MKLLPAMFFGCIIAAAAQDAPSLHTLIDGPGGPRKVLEWDAGRIDQIPSSETSGMALPYMVIHGEKVEEKGATTTGARLTLYGLAGHVADRRASDIFNFMIGESEIASLSEAVRAAEALPPLSDPRLDAQIYVRWESRDGLIFIAGSTGIGQPVGYSLSTSTDDGPILELTRAQVDILLSIVRRAGEPPK